MTDEEKISIEYKKQEPKDDEEANLGIREYSELERDFHKDVISLLEAEKYKNLPATSLPTIMARVYSNFMIRYLESQGDLELTDE